VANYAGAPTAQAKRHIRWIARPGGLARAASGITRRPQDGRVVNFQLHALRKAARILGGEERLREILDAPPGAFSRWMQGVEPVPQVIFLSILDFLADMESGVQPFGSAGETLPARSR
jgi:hypothetical protein